MKIAVYRKTDGFIVKRITCPINDVDLQCNENEEFYLNCSDTVTHIISGTPITIVLEPPPFTQEELLCEIRCKRDMLLDNTDLKYCNAERWYNMPPEKQIEWSNYKQALREFPTICDIQNPIWPVLPE
jgi:hypothetical protein